MKKMTIIKTKDFILRPVRLSDAKMYFECQNDPIARKNFMSNPKNISEAKKELLEQLKGMKKSPIPHFEGFAIEIGGKTAGFIWIDGMDEEHSQYKAGIGYFIHKNFRGRGLGSKAIRILTDYAFRKYKLKRMATVTRDFNIGSRRALEKAGYKLEGIMKKNKFKDGKYLNDCLYAKVK